MKEAKRPAIWFPTIRTGSGVDVFTQQLSDGLRRRGIWTEITWLPHRAEYAPYSITPPKMPYGINIAHINIWLPIWILPKNIPIVSTVHICVHDSSLQPYKTLAQRIYHQYWIRRVEQAALTRSTKVVAVSHYTASKIRATHSISSIDVIYNGVDTESFFYPKKDKHPHKPFRLLYVGNWSKRKGVDLLAPIMKDLGEAFELRYTSDRFKEDRKHLEQTEIQNATPIGRLNGPQAMASAYQSADALLFPTRLEGLPLTVIEAQSCGLPVITTHGSSLPEIISNDFSGLLCKQDDISAFVEAARKLESNPSIWRNMCDQSRQNAEQNFNLEKMIDSYILVYEEMLGTA